MGRPRKPTALLELTGAFKRNPQRWRARSNEPKPTGPIGDYPSDRAVTPADIWDELVIQCAPGVLQKYDRVALEMTADLLAKYRASQIGPDGARCFPSIDTKYIALLDKLLARFGMNPSDRTKLSV